jgi:hypothetical protein
MPEMITSLNWPNPVISNKARNLSSLLLNWPPRLAISGSSSLWNSLLSSISRSSRDESWLFPFLSQLDPTAPSLALEDKV